jgi:hypothetical protein
MSVETRETKLETTMADLKDTLAILGGVVLMGWLFVSGRRHLCNKVWNDTLDNLPSLKR